MLKSSQVAPFDGMENNFLKKHEVVGFFARFVFVLSFPIFDVVLFCLKNCLIRLYHLT